MFNLNPCLIKKKLNKTSADKGSEGDSGAVFFAPSSPQELECIVDVDTEGGCVDEGVGDARAGGGGGGVEAEMLVVEESGQEEVTEDEAMLFRADGKKVYPCHFCGKVGHLKNKDASIGFFLWRWER